MATSNIPATPGFFSWYPNGTSLAAVADGCYRTAPSSMPQEGVLGNQYGTILKFGITGYLFCLYIGVDGHMGVLNSQTLAWRTITVS